MTDSVFYLCTELILICFVDDCGQAQQRETGGAGEDHGKPHQRGTLQPGGRGQKVHFLQRTKSKS